MRRYDWPKISAWAGGLAFSILVWAGLALLLSVVAGLMFRTPAASSHPLPKGTSITIGLHKICRATLICRDRAPQPQVNCWWGNRGLTEEIYDPTLDALVTWRCACPDGEYGHCRWVRVSIRPMPADYLKPPNRHHVWDWQRRCASLVCAKFRVDHFYRSLRYYPGTL